MNTRDSLASALERLIVGYTRESTPTCEWYEGIEFDALEEGKEALRIYQQGIIPNITVEIKGEENGS